MRLSTKGRYGVVAMLDIAMYSKENDYVSIFSISERNNISVSYLEQLFIKLKKNNLVISAKGPKGGYRLKRLPSEIFVSEIVNAVDETINFMGCTVATKVCSKSKRCNSHDLWHYLMNRVHDYLEQISLETVINKEFTLIEPKRNNKIQEKARGCNAKQ